MCRVISIDVRYLMCRVISIDVRYLMCRVISIDVRYLMCRVISIDIRYLMCRVISIDIRYRICRVISIDLQRIINNKGSYKAKKRLLQFFNFYVLALAGDCQRDHGKQIKASNLIINVLNQMEILYVDVIRVDIKL